MQLIKLPSEILHLMLFYAALNRGIKRALRLGVVCKTFERNLYPALRETHILDNPVVLCGNAIGSEVWQFRHQHGADKLWQRYLSYRILNRGLHNPVPETVGIIRQFADIRQIAQTICQEPGHSLDLNATINELCRLTAGHGIVMTRDMLKCWLTWPKGSAPPPGPTKTASLSSTAHFHLLSVCKRLLDQGLSPVARNYIFTPPVQVAAQAGYIVMLQLMLQLFWSKLLRIACENRHYDITDLLLEYGADANFEAQKSNPA